METNNKLKLLTWSVIFLVIVNISALALVWVNSTKEKNFGPRMGPPPRGKEQGMDKGKDPIVRMLSEELGWSEEQMKKFEELKKTKFKDAEDMRDSILFVKKDLLNAIYTIPVDSGKITELTKKLGAIQYNIERVMFLHFTDIVNICTPEQREKCKQLLNAIILRGNAHSGNHEDGPNGPPGPPRR